MKKRDNSGLVYFMAFTFLAVCVFGGLGFYNNFSIDSVTGSATDVSLISNSISDTLNLIIRGFVEPIFGEITGDNSGILIRLILWIILFSFISMVLSRNKEMNKGTVNVVSGLIPLIGVSFLPEEFIRALGPIGAFLIVLGLVIFAYRWIYNFEKDNLNFFVKSIKVILFLVMIVFLSIMTPWFETIFGSDLGELYYLAIGLGAAVGFIFILYFIFKGGDGSSNSSPKAPKKKLFGGGSKSPSPKQPAPQQGPSPGQNPQPSAQQSTIDKNKVMNYLNSIKSSNAEAIRELNKSSGFDSSKVVSKNQEIFNFCRSIVAEVSKSPGPAQKAVSALCVELEKKAGDVVNSLNSGMKQGNVAVKQATGLSSTISKLERQIRSL